MLTARLHKNFFVVLVTLLLAASLRAADKAPLSAKHKKWLEEEVVYIISDDEKKVFKSLPNDDDREKFIRRFWDIRDPTPGTEENEYKDEHYRRIQYANQYYSEVGRSDGWRTDRGKIYIILGPPKTVAHHAGGADTYPSELWFYSSDEPSLPPFFYVLFYVRNDIGDYKLYSPYVDGPTKLVRTSGTENNPRGAYQRLLQYNYELARASLTLIPSEPAEVGMPSLSSDGMLMKILNLANDKFHKQRIEERGRLREEVRVKISFDVPALEAVVFPLRDAAGQAVIHYSLQVPDPQNFTMGQLDNKYYASVEAQVRVLDSEKKEIYTVTREASATYDEATYEIVRAQQFHFVDRLPVVPGNYHLEFTLLNKLDHVFYRGTASVRVEPPNGSQLAVGEPVLVQRCQPTRDPNMPFNFGGNRCTLLGRAEITTGPAAAVSVLFPVYTPAGASEGAPPLKVEYTVGRLDRGMEPKVVQDTLDRSRVDRFGTLLVGKSIPLEGLTPGSLRLAVRVTDPATHQSVATTLPFKLVQTTQPSANVVTSADYERDETNGTNDYRRGLCALAQKRDEDAGTYFEHALQRNDQESVRVQLAAVYYDRGDYGKVAEVLQPVAITKATDWDTVRRLVASLEKTGQLSGAIQKTEEAVSVLEPTPEMYEELAKLYDRAGEADLARQARERSRRLAEQKTLPKSERK
ncbi:MAG TPA: GWxTD domain-containing protein [Candidatus Xenobia bacterium]|nr:GWxTD domain-containing protein [Candidatus Xenobia bacterium]